MKIFEIKSFHCNFFFVKMAQLNHFLEVRIHMSNKYGFREDETMYKRYLVPFCHSLFNFLIVFVGSSNISE